MSDPDPPPAGTGDGRPLLPSDLQLLAGLGRANEWTRSLLCTLARRGTWLRHGDPERSEALLEAVTPWPWYKAGQFLFDLFEWEDFMTDGPPPPDFAGPLDDLSLQRVVQLLRLLASQLDGTLPAWDEEAAGVAASVSDAPSVSEASSMPPHRELPPLEPGFHLYQDVVLGVLISSSTPPAGGGRDP